MTQTVLPISELENRAAAQRRQIHHSVQELRESVRDTLDLRRNVREHIGPAAGFIAVVGFLLGWGVVSVFRD